MNETNPINYNVLFREQTKDHEADSEVLQKLSGFISDEVTYKLALAMTKRPATLGWAVTRLGESLPYTAPEAIHYKWCMIYDETDKVKKEHDGLPLTQIVAQASTIKERGQDVKGILIQEGLFYDIYQSEIGFEGIVRCFDANGVDEFYVRPLTEEQQAKLGIDSMGTYGVVFTPYSKEDLEEQLK